VIIATEAALYNSFVSYYFIVVEKFHYTLVLNQRVRYKGFSIRTNAIRAISSSPQRHGCDWRTEENSEAGYLQQTILTPQETTKTRLLFALVGLAISFALPTFTQQNEPTPSESTPEATPTPTLGDHFTQVLPDRRVTFRLLAPNANVVEVAIGIKSGVYESQGTTVTKMTKDVKGFWTVTLGPFEPNLYEYQFHVDGCTISDPGNDMPKPQRHVDTSLLLIPGTPPDFLDTQNGAHGTLRDETYYSTTLGKNRRVLIYTPPSYDRSHAPLPVLYLYHGFYDTRYSWVTEGKLPQILDNLLAQGKAVPMIVVVPEAHALAFELAPETKPNFWTNLDDFRFWVKNQAMADEELFHDIIPFIETHYNISDEPRGRAIAGLSMGGLQAMETGIVHLGYFSWVGAFSPAISPSGEFQNALNNPNKINENLRLFEIDTGDNDFTTGPSTHQFEIQLRALKIQHVYTVMPGTHSMLVWRPALCNFLQKIFTPAAATGTATPSPTTTPSSQ
jgi:enterochelin esterase family protein